VGGQLFHKENNCIELCFTHGIRASCHFLTEPISFEASNLRGNLLHGARIYTCCLNINCIPV